MAAKSFIAVSRGETIGKAFSNAMNNAIREYGNYGFTGTIAEKDSFVLIDYKKEKKEGESEREFCMRLTDEGDPRIENKWGPAGCIESVKNPGLFIFFGWAYN